jgi:hypothetical protein
MLFFHQVLQQMVFLSFNFTNLLQIVFASSQSNVVNYFEEAAILMVPTIKKTQ